MLSIALYFMLVAATLADDPIVHLFSKCPGVDSGKPSLRLTADVPAYALAKCRNGDKPLTLVDGVNYKLDGSFSQSFTGDGCQFYKKEGVRTYTVDVEFGWGERDTQIVQQRQIHTISCAYDPRGKAISKTETIANWFLDPWEKLADITRHKYLRYLRPSEKVNSFRALSCALMNSKSKYFLLRAGCGDGLVFSKTLGFNTMAPCVFSPWFEAFKLSR